MQQIHTSFEAVLTKLGTKRVQEKSLLEGDDRDQSEIVKLTTTLRYTYRTNGAQTFLEGLQSRWGVQGTKNLFILPVAWKSIAIELVERLEFKVTFDEQVFDTRLVAIKVKRTFKKDIEEVTYDLEFERELARDTELMLAYYLNKREYDPETGKKRLLTYFCELRPLDETPEDAARNQEEKRQLAIAEAAE